MYETKLYHCSEGSKLDKSNFVSVFCIHALFYFSLGMSSVPKTLGHVFKGHRKRKVKFSYILQYTEA